jgi:hypothetical protein
MKDPATIDHANETRTPVVLLIYNRPQLTKCLIDRLRQARPREILVVADGPKPGQPADERRCRQARQLVANGIDWDCQLQTRYAETNLGCGRNVSSGLDWAFEQVEEAIILEDDCLPKPGFFRFCSELLERFRNELSIAQICGTAGPGEFRTSESSSYLFSHYGPVWGWATWKRAWQLYDFSLSNWLEERDMPWLNTFDVSFREKIWRRRIYDRLHAGHIDTWDYQWGYAKFKHQRLSVIPTRNLVENVGFGEYATHTRKNRAPASSRSLNFPLKHPVGIGAHRELDRFFSRANTPGWIRLGYQAVRAMVIRKGLAA